jgi:dihydroorotate dehydrogenase
VPLALKISPDLDWNQVREIGEAVSRHRIDAVIATNTSAARSGVEHLPPAKEAGGLSGAPIRGTATRVLKDLDSSLRGAATLIGAGGILGAEDVRQKIAAGAKLVQLYTGLVYRGPGLVAECVSAFRAK